MPRWFGLSNRFEHLPDTFTQRRARIVNAIVDVARNETNKGRLTVVLAHFPDTFAEMTDALESQAVHFNTLDDNVPTTFLKDTPFERNALPVIGWSGSFLQMGDNNLDRMDLPMSVVVIERHPLAARDRLLIKNMRRLSNDVRIGWYLSFEDPVVSTCLGESGVNLMRMLGMKSNDIVTSEMLGNRINRVLRSKSMQCDPGIKIESATDWAKIVKQKA